MKYFVIRYHKASATIGYKVYKAVNEEKAIEKFQRYYSAAILGIEEIEDDEVI